MNIPEILLHPTLSEALLAGAVAIGGVLLGAVIPTINQKLSDYSSDRKVLAQLVSTMDLLLGDRINLTIGSIDVGAIAKEAAQRLAATDSVSVDQAMGLIGDAARLWSPVIFQEKLGGDAA